MLHSDAEGFRILDFEGEPLRPSRKRAAGRRPPGRGGRRARSTTRQAMAGRENGRTWVSGPGGVRRLPGGLQLAQRKSRGHGMGVLFRALAAGQGPYEVVYEERGPMGPGAGGRRGSFARHAPYREQ
ncbi:hypothetical protein QJS66_09450 [Kocuria rhizophila]|nr:hypothetical protein QJS66_09450 [Kocuria rhizophila]